MHRGYFDASYSSKGAKAGIVIINSKGTVILEKTVKLEEVKTSLEAECAALVELLKEAIKLKLARLNALGDCLTLVQMLQSKRTYSKYAKYLNMIKELIQYIKQVSIEWIERKKNSLAHNQAVKPVTPEQKPSINKLIRKWKNRK